MIYAEGPKRFPYNHHIYMYIYIYIHSYVDPLGYIGHQHAKCRNFAHCKDEETGGLASPKFSLLFRISCGPTHTLCII